MAKKSAAKHVEPEEISQSEPTVSKAEAVRQALSAGMDSPGDGTAFIKAHFGIEMDKQTFSSNKAQQKARDAKLAVTPKGKPGRKPATASQSVEAHSAPAPKKHSGAEGDILETLEALKPLIASHGADRVKRLVDLIG